jgi:hypothetical protein
MFISSLGAFCSGLGVTFKGRPLAIATLSDWSKSKFLFSNAMNSWLNVSSYSTNDDATAKREKTMEVGGVNTERE